jgi:hypothetical protein
MTFLYAVGRLHDMGLAVSVVTPSVFQVHLADFLVTLSFGRGSLSSNGEALQFHAPNAAFTAKDCQVIISQWGESDVLLDYGFVAPTCLVRLIEGLCD